MKPYIFSWLYGILLVACVGSLIIASYSVLNTVRDTEMETQIRESQDARDAEDDRVRLILSKIELQLELDDVLIDEEVKKPVLPSPVQCLTDNIYYEAGFEPYEGQLAVAQVTINRAGNESNVCRVVYFKKVNPHTGKKEAAFSWTLGKKWRAKGINKSHYRECAQLARAVLTKHVRSGIIDSSVKFYHATYIQPSWKDNYQMVAQIGNHIFYR
jgi:N-acetylmuramoyl-L-alanine amidase